MPFFNLGVGIASVAVPRSLGNDDDKKFEAAFEGINLALLLVDTHGKIVLANASAENLFQFNRTELQGQEVEFLIPDRFRPNHLNDRNDYSRAPVRRPMGAGGDLYARRKDGVEIPVEIALSPIQTPEGRFVLASIVDISQRKKAEDALRESEERYRMLFERHPHPMWVFDVETLNFLAVNDAAIRQYGYSREEFLAMSIKDIRPAEEVPRLLADVSAGTIGLDSAGRWKHHHKDGALREVEVTSREIEHRGRKAKVVLALDITDRVRAEEELRGSEERFSKAFRLSPVAKSITRLSDGLFIDINEGFEHVLGFTKADLVGTVGLDRNIIVDRNAREEILGRLHTNGSIREYEVTMRTKTGDLRTTLLSAERITIGGEVCLLTIIFDITDRKRAEEAIRKMNEDLEQRVKERTAQLEAANKELEAFAYSVSHDLRAPLRRIDGFSQALMEDHAASLSGEAMQFLQRSRVASQTMGQLIDDLLSLSRLTRHKMHRVSVDLSALVRAVSSDIRKSDPERSAEFVIEDGLFVSADPHLIQILLTNLIDNAWKYSRKHPAPRIEFGSLREDGATVYYVRDNGSGFDMKYSHKLFIPFQRLHVAEDFEGTGIGLATAQRIVRRHGGRIWATGAIDRGATFLFTLSSSQESDDGNEEHFAG